MPQYRKESHARSLLKGISWRIVATADTVAVVMLVTWWMTGTPSLGDALKIGLTEFLIKYLIYYVHERVWESLRTGDGLDNLRTFKKAISWRILATSMTFVIASIVLESFDSVAATIAGVEFVSKFLLYYAHERIWLMLPLGRIRNYLFGKRAKAKGAVNDSDQKIS
ncbi:DUF2061 domain-containing protein [Mariniblastus sp.]|nr:DUF2061 domain-containing protein [Mariniblastus sp.]